MNSPRIPEGLQTFLAHAESLHPSNNPKGENGFAKEFQQLKTLSSQLKKDPKYSCDHGELECNRPKNRYKDIVPFDYNRIILPTLPEVPGSDYINGNYVKGPDGSTSYLASQGPLPRTVDDFWRLIASHRCQVVIMVCKEIEMGKLKCKRYWPESMDEKLNFGGLHISLMSEYVISEGFLMRTMLMKSAQDEMTVTQLQYTAWPDHDVPKSAEPLIEMNRTLKSLQGNRKQPILVHCSAGCGRTGTICAVDYAWTLLKMKKTNNFSVYDIVANLRKQRMAMVQTKEQYALVYKAVVQLVNEELKEEELKYHTYVNVNIPTSPTSPSGHSDYENADFIKSVSRWQESEIQNGPVPRALLAEPKETEGSIVAKQIESSKELPAAGKTRDYVNFDFGSKNDVGSKFVAAAPNSKPPVSMKPTFPRQDLNKPTLNSSAVKGGNSQAVADYKVLPGTASGPPGLNLRNETTAQRSKGTSSDYEIPPASVSSGDKALARHVPEGLLIDLGDDVLPLPGKRHSVGSSKYENIQGLLIDLGDNVPPLPVKPQSPPLSSSKRSSGSPDVLDDMLLLGGSGLQPEKNKNVADSKGFHTVPNRLKALAGPKRCPLTADVFEVPLVKQGSGCKVGDSPTEPSGQYSLVGATSPSSPPKPPNLAAGAGPQMTRPFDLTLTSVQPKKQGEKSKVRAPVGAYSLVGIPETTKQTTTLGKQTAGGCVEVRGKTGDSSDIQGKPSVEPSYELVGEQWQQPGKKVSPTTPSVPTGNVNNPTYSTVKPGIPVEVNGGPTVEPSYELVGQQWQQPVHISPAPPAPYGQASDARSNGVPHTEAKRGVKSQEDGEAANSVADIYAAVVKPSSSPSLNAKFAGSPPELRNQTSSGSLMSNTSSSSDDLEKDAPPIPEKTNEAYLAPGEEPYETVQQTNKGTLDRFKKMIKTGAKSSLPKRLSDTLPNVLPRTNSSGNGVVAVTARLDDIGYKKRVGHPKGPRACPRDWPQMTL